MKTEPHLGHHNALLLKQKACIITNASMSLVNASLPSMFTLRSSPRSSSTSSVLRIIELALEMITL